MIELSPADLSQGRVRRAIEVFPKNDINGETQWTTEGSIDTNANCDATQDQSASVVNSENQTDIKNVLSDKTTLIVNLSTVIN